jgi:hypothetical protein
MNDTFWLNYLFFCDFTDSRDAISGIPGGVLSADNATLLAAALSSHDTGQYRADWTDAADADFSLAGASVVYNGKNDTNLPSNARFDNVLILSFTKDGKKPLGRIVLNYNDTPKPADGSTAPVVTS